jgi:hypothetical protein
MLRKKYINLVLHGKNVKKKNYWLHLHSPTACQSHHKKKKNKKWPPHKKAAHHTFYNRDNEARLNFVTWYYYALHGGEIDPTLILISGKAWFHLSELMNSQSKMFPMLIHKVTSLDVHLGIWCAMNANRITGPIYISWCDKFTVTYYTHRQYFLTPVQLHNKLCLLPGRQCKLRQQMVLCIVSRVLLVTISNGSSPLCSPGMSQFSFYFWGMLKYKVYYNNNKCIIIIIINNLMNIKQYVSTV